MGTANNNLLRLEVDASDVLNKVANHSGQNASYTGWNSSTGSTGGWSVGNASSFGYNGNALYISNSTVNAVAQVQSDPIAITPGQYAAFQVSYKTFNDSDAGASVRFKIGYYDSSNIQIGQFNSLQAMRSFDQTYKQQVSQAPAGAVSWRVIIEVTPLSGKTAAMYFYKVMAVQSSSRAAVEDVPFTDQPAWQNMLGNAYSIKTSRGMDVDGVEDKPQVGSLSAMLVDPLFDPVNNPRMRPGRKIRLTAQAPNGYWFPLWGGRISTLDNSYVNGKVRTSITATDAWAELANIPVPRGYSGTYKQRIMSIMGQSTVPYYITDPASNTSSVVIDSQENATALDQLVWARNSMQGFMYMGPEGALYAYAAGQLGTSPGDVFSDSASDTSAIKYTDIECNFGSQALVNQLLVQRHNLDETANDGNKTYGPYSNATSVQQWGVRSATLNVNDGVPATLAANALAVYANPSIFVSSLKFSGNQHYDRLSYLDLYDAVTVKFAKANLNAVYRILSMEHDITPDSWEVKVDFRPMETPSTITVTNPPAGANTGPGDVTGPAPGILGRRFRNSSQGTISANSALTVDYNQVATANGITWDGTNKRFVIPRTGRYYVDAAARINGPVCYRHLSIYVNGANYVRTLTYADNINTEQVSAALTFNAGDVVSIVALTTSACSIDSDGAGDTHCSIHFIGD